MTIYQYQRQKRTLFIIFDQSNRNRDLTEMAREIHVVFKYRC
jgi:hypothetical protein